MHPYLSEKVLILPWRRIAPRARGQLLPNPAAAARTRAPAPRQGGEWGGGGCCR